MSKVFPFELKKGTGVRAIQAIGNIEAGDTGHVVAAWLRATPAVKWDNGKGTMPINRKRLELNPASDVVYPEVVFVPRAIATFDVNRLRS